jgi:tetratricopeptide (TPR) repeat protein
MLGKQSFVNKSIFLLTLWLLAACPGWSQGVWRSPNFRIISEKLTEPKARQSLERLETLRAALKALRGPAWEAVSPLPVWVPASEAEWRRVAQRSTEQGVFLSGSRRDWIVVNPAAPNFLEVLSHEYVHAVLHRAAPNLPTWFEEGVCEYYSSVKVRRKGGNWQIVEGEAPGNRRWLVGGETEVRLADLSQGRLDQRGYALAWAAAVQLLPEYREGMEWPQRVALKGYPVRVVEWRDGPPAVQVAAVAGEEARGWWADLRARVPQAPAAEDGAEELFLRGVRLADGGQPREAIVAMEEACRKRPEQSTWWLALAQAYQEVGRVEEARTAAERASETALNETEQAAARAFLKSLEP